jgi:hypothetical protein
VYRQLPFVPMTMHLASVKDIEIYID